MKIKITDPNYYLPTIIATSNNKVATSGTTQPMFINGYEQQTGERGQYIIKYINATRMSTQASARELIGAWVGTQLELNTIEPVIIEVSQGFVDIIRGQDGYLNASNSIGINFGSKYVAGYNEMVAGRPIPSEILNEQLKDIFAFDMFISNADRGHQKPNILTNGKNFLLFDHELAFSFIFLLPFLRNKTPWILGDSEKEMYKNHYFFKYIKGSNINFDEFTERFAMINEDFWVKVSQHIPSQWVSDEIITIKEYLKAITDNRKIFSEQLKKVLQ